MAAVPELPYEVQQYEARKRAEFKASNGYSATKYLMPDFLMHFPVVMESTEAEEHLSWNEVSGLFRRRDAIPATFIDQSLLVEQIDLEVFGKPDMEIAERRVLALFKLITKEGDRYALTVVYIPYYQKRMAMKLALPAAAHNHWERRCLGRHAQRLHQVCLHARARQWRALHPVASVW